MTIDEKIYITICVLFAILIVTGNLIYQKFVFLPILPFYTFELSVGAITYPLTFLLTAKLTLCKVLNSVKRVNVTAVAYNDLKALTLFDKPSYLFCVQFFLEKPTLKMHN